MPHILIRSEQHTWLVAPFEAASFHLSNEAFRPDMGAPSRPGLLQKPVILRCYACASERWALVVPRGADIRVNGEPVLTQIRVLRHRDSLYVPEIGTVYFSTERLARVEKFTGDSNSQFCGRCKKPFERGQDIVRCPNPTCGMLHHKHADPDRCCWQYMPQCSGCDQPTALDAGLQWIPEEAWQ